MRGRPRGSSAEHGTYARYQSGPCRCMPCRVAASVYWRERKKLSRDRKKKETTEANQ